MNKFQNIKKIVIPTRKKKKFLKKQLKKAKNIEKK